MSQIPKGFASLLHKSVKLPIQLKLHSEANYPGDSGSQSELENDSAQIRIFGNTQGIYYDGLCIDTEIAVDNEEVMGRNAIWMNKIVDLEVVVSDNNRIQAHGIAKWYYIPEKDSGKLELGMFITQISDGDRNKWDELLLK